MNSASKHWQWLYIGLVGLLFYACEYTIHNVSDTTKYADTTLLVYMLADNNLEPFALSDLNEIEEGLHTYQQTDSNVQVIVYMDKWGEAPGHGVIIEMQADGNTDKIVRSPVVLPLLEENSSDPDVFKTVLTTMMDLYPSKEYALVVWSHGSGWVPPKYTPVTEQKKDDSDTSTDTSAKEIIAKSFGQDSTSDHAEMSIIDFASTIESLDKKLSYIIFDACYMGDVEVAYQLRNASEYLVFSQAEIQFDGFPYNEIIPTLLNTNATIASRLSKAAEQYYGYYNKLKGVRQTATVSVIATAQLSTLANAVNAYIKKNTITPLYQAAVLNAQKVSTIPQIDKLHYDMLDLFKQGVSYNYTSVKNAFTNTVRKSYHTKSLFGTVDLDNINGLSMFVPTANTKVDTSLKAYYASLAWGKDSGIAETWK